MTLERLSGTQIEKEDFSGADLRAIDLSFSKFIQCSFDKADMSESDCEGTDFAACTFRDTNLYRANLKDAKLAGCVFEPRDCYGMTVTLQCQTFMCMSVSAKWWYCWLMFATMMVPSELLLKDKLIGLIGAVRYSKLKALFTERDI